MFWVELTNNTVEQADGDDRENGPEWVPEQEVSVLEEAETNDSEAGFKRSEEWCYLLLTAPRTVDHEPEQRSDTHDDLVEEIDDHVAISSIRPVPVDEQQPLQESELYAMISI